MLEIANEIINNINDIKYGWYDKKGKVHYHISEGFPNKFKFQSCEELEKSRIGICWETVELTRKYLEEKEIPCKTYFFVIPNINLFCHSVLVINDNKNYFWLENSFKDLKGIRQYNSLQLLFNDVLSNFHLIVGRKKFNIENIKIYEYSKPKDKLNCVLFYLHCFNGKNITNEYLPEYLKNIK